MASHNTWNKSTLKKREILYKYLIYQFESFLCIKFFFVYFYNSSSFRMNETYSIKDSLLNK